MKRPGIDLSQGLLLGAADPAIQRRICQLQDRLANLNQCLATASNVTNIDDLQRDAGNNERELQALLELTGQTTIF